MDNRVRMVTELEIRRLTAGLDPLRLTIQLGLEYAESAGLKPRTVARWEAGEHLPYAVHGQALSKYFKVASIAWLGLGCGPVAARWRTYMTPEELTEEVNRRQMNALTANATAALLLPVPDLVAVAQLLGRRAHVNAGDVATARATATDIAAAYLAKPDTELRRAARTHAYTLLDLLEHARMSPDTHTALAGIACDAASLVGVGHLDAGRLDQADAWFAEALELARQAGDRRLEALALANCAWPSLFAPQPDRAAGIAALEAAAELQRFLPPAGRAWVFAYLSREHAALGHDLISGRFLDLARAASAWIGRAGPGWGWWSTQGELGGLDGLRLETFTGLRSLRLGRPAEALELFDAALTATTAPPLRAAWQGRVTEACIALDDPDRACASANAALDDADTYDLGLYRQRAREARRTFPTPWATLKPVVELDERLALAR
ncbi:MAG: hypothetical protein ACRDYA_12920 [Egibacteraceae bacterium]